MKKLMTMLGVAGVAVAAFAAANDTLISFSTPGPDKYADGTDVLPGECYALVWSADGQFDGVKADGSTVDPEDKIVLVAEIAKAGENGMCCPPLVYQVDAKTAEALAGGVYAVYLLDTRVADETGALAKVAGLDDSGKLTVVNTGVATSEAAAATAGLGGSVAASGKSNVAYTVDNFAPVDAPVITGMEVKGAKITITASGLSPAANYWIVNGATPDMKAKTKIADAKFDADGKCTFDKPAAPFFKIEGGHKVELKK